MNKILWISGWRLPVWRIAATVLAVFFVVLGSSKLLAPQAGISNDLGPLMIWIGGAELIGGLMLLVPGLVSHAAFFLAPIVCLIALVGSLNIGREVVMTAGVILVALVWLGHARRPGPLLRARLERALERVVRLEMSQREGVRHESL